MRLRNHFFHFFWHFFLNHPFFGVWLIVNLLNQNEILVFLVSPCLTEFYPVIWDLFLFTGFVFLPNPAEFRHRGGISKFRVFSNFSEFSETMLPEVKFMRYYRKRVNLSLGLRTICLMNRVIFLNLSIQIGINNREYHCTWCNSENCIPWISWIGKSKNLLNLWIIQSKFYWDHYYSK